MLVLSARQVFHTFRLGVFHYGFIIDFYSHLFALYNDVLCEPFIVLYIYLFYILHTIQAAGPSPIALRVIHLYFVTFRGPVTVLVLCMNKNAGVGTGCGH